MSTQFSKPGFSIIELAVVIVVIGIIGFLGYRLYSGLNSNGSTSQSATAESAKSSDVLTPPASITSASDLDKEAAILNQTNPGGSNNSDASLLDSEVSNF